MRERAGVRRRHSRARAPAIGVDERRQRGRAPPALPPVPGGLRRFPPVAEAGALGRPDLHRAGPGWQSPAVRRARRLISSFYSAAARRWICAAATLEWATSSPRFLLTAAPPPAVSAKSANVSISSSTTG